MTDPSTSGDTSGITGSSRSLPQSLSTSTVVEEVGSQRLRKPIPQNYSEMVREVHALTNALGPMIALVDVSIADANTPSNVRDMLVLCLDQLTSAARSASHLSALIRGLDPELAKATQASREPRSELPASESLPRLRLLCVEDDETVCELLVKLLTLLGQSAVAVNTVTEAWSLFNREPFDIVLTDLRLGSESGQDLTVMLRETRPVPVIWITGFNSERDPSELSPEAAPTYILQKPVSIDGLRRALQVAAKSLPSSSVR